MVVVVQIVVVFWTTEDRNGLWALCWVIRVTTWRETKILQIPLNHHCVSMMLMIPSHNNMKWSRTKSNTITRQQPQHVFFWKKLLNILKVIFLFMQKNELAKALWLCICNNKWRCSRICIYWKHFYNFVLLPAMSMLISSMTAVYAIL